MTTTVAEQLHQLRFTVLAVLKPWQQLCKTMEATVRDATVA
jgi:hypothetical protein